jgi:hypothetical protein
MSTTSSCAGGSAPWLDQVDVHYTLYFIFTYNFIDRLNRHTRQTIIICVLEPSLWLPPCPLTAHIHNPTNIVASNAFNKHAKIAGKLQIVICLAPLSFTYPNRRKKAKCSGKRPICGYCERLSQDCQWDDAPRRMSNISNEIPDAGGSGSDQGALIYDVGTPSTLFVSETDLCI